MGDEGSQELPKLGLIVCLFCTNKLFAEIYC